MASSFCSLFSKCHALSTFFCCLSSHMRLIKRKNFHALIFEYWTTFNELNQICAVNQCNTYKNIHTMSEVFVKLWETKKLAHKIYQRRERTKKKKNTILMDLKWTVLDICKLKNQIPKSRQITNVFMSKIMPFSFCSRFARIILDAGCFFPSLFHSHRWENVVRIE